MAAAVPHKWMFRTAAVVFLFFGGSMLWRFGFTGYEPQFRHVGVAVGALWAGLGMFLFRLARFAVGASAVCAGVVSICAVVAVPVSRGPVILFLALLALACGGYAVLAVRALRADVNSA